MRPLNSQVKVSQAELTNRPCTNRVPSMVTELKLHVSQEMTGTQVHKVNASQEDKLLDTTSYLTKTPAGCPSQTQAYSSVGTGLKLHEQLISSGLTAMAQLHVCYLF